MYEQLKPFIDQTLKTVKRREGRRGDCEARRTHSDWILVKLWTLCAIQKWTMSLFFAKLKREGLELRKEWRLPNRLPCRSVAYERMVHPSFGYRLLEFFHECTRQALRRSPEEGTETVAIDLTALAAPLGDTGAAWGRTSAKWLFWGYKLGLVVTRSGVPIAFRLMKANWVEGNVSIPLIREAKQRLHEAGRLDGLRYAAGDKGFDAEKNYRQVAAGTQAILVCPGRKKHKRRVKNPYGREWFARKRYPYRTRAVSFAQTEEGRAIYRHRVVVEQMNGQLKADPFALGRIPPHVRGLRRMRLWCLGRLLHYVLALNVNLREGRFNRQLKAFAA